MKVAEKPVTAHAAASTSVSGEPTRVPVDQIVRMKALLYRPVDASHVESLLEDIAVNGLDVPLITFAEQIGQEVRPKGSDKNQPAHYLAAGQHRIEAVRRMRREKPEAFKKHFPDGCVPVIHRIGDVREMLLLTLREGAQRKDMTAEEVFPILEKLTEEFKMTGKEIAKRIGKSQAWVSQHVAIETLPDDVVADVKTGKIALGDARKLAAETNKARKSGGDATAATVRTKAAALKAKQTAKVASGSQRATGEERRTSAKKLLGRFKALPSLPLARKGDVLYGALEYLAQEKDSLPAELRKDPVKPSKVVAKKK